MISLAMIVKNEAQTIERTITSVRDYIDEVIIGLDSESSDDTEEIIQHLADKVIPIHLSEELSIKGPINGHTDWGFSKARNTILDSCKQDNWRLILDGHETLTNPKELPTLVKKAKTKGYDAIEMNVDFEPAADNIPNSTFLNVRVLAPSVVYENPIHNLPKNKNAFITDAVKVIHRKSDQAKEDKLARDAQRSNANVDGLKKKAKEDPTNARTWFYLATSYKENGKFQEAADNYEECLKHSVWGEERWHCLYNIGVCYNCLKNEPKAREHFTLAVEESPFMVEAYYQLGEMAYRKKNYREAELWFLRCTELNTPICKLFLDTRTYLVRRYDSLSMTYNHLGQYGRAIEYAKKALEAAPNARISKNIDVWQKCINKHTAKYYDNIWSKHRGPTNREKKRMQFMAAELDGAKSVVDVGSGPGYVMDYLPEGITYTGVDISKVARESIVKKGGRALDKLEGLFDGCLLGEYLEHVEDDVTELKQISKHLAPHSIIVASVPKFAVMQDPAHTRDYTEKEFINLMSTVGVVKKTKHIGPWVICVCQTL